MEYASNFGNNVRFSFEIDPKRPNELRIVNTVRLMKNPYFANRSFVGKTVMRQRFTALDIATGERIPCVTLIGNFGAMGIFLDTRVMQNAVKTGGSRIAFPPVKARRLSR
jgi:hypothetical protein